MKFGGALWIANCETSAFTWDLTKTSGATSGTATVTETPPVYIHYGATGEGGGGPMVDNGNLPDLDNDGIPDNEDPDDDGDGRPDETDAFPRDPNEKDDTDGDGQGNNADPDDDGDGRPDVDDDHPYDPTKQDLDTDGDGVRDKDDKFPTNPREWADNDKDGVGDNQDPNDNTPPKPDGSDPDNEGDDGDPGTGDGDGGPGPKPKPGDSGTDTGEAGTGDTSGTIRPTAAHDVAGKGSVLAPALANKLGNFNPVGVTAIGKATSYTIAFSTSRFGAFQYVIDFSSSPWPQMRMLVLICIVLMVGASAVRFTKV